MNYGKILSIEEIFNATYEGSNMDGWKVITDETIVLVLIDNYQSCCESWGYFSSEDDYTPFIGSELKEIQLTNIALNQKQIIEKYGDWFEDMIQFVDFVTDKGVFQLAVYNDHNGYYGHDIAVVIGDKVIHKSCI